MMLKEPIFLYIIATYILFFNDRVSQLVCVVCFVLFSNKSGLEP